MLPLVRDYIAQVRQLTQLIRQACVVSDSKAAVELCGRLAESGTNFGFAPISLAGQKVNQLAHLNPTDTAAIITEVQRMVGLLESVHE
jgi:hypothetical protein